MDKDKEKKAPGACRHETGLFSLVNFIDMQITISK